MSKRILYFVPEFPRISETFIEREISKLIEWNKVDLTILSLTKAGGTTSDKVYNKTIYKRISAFDLACGLTFFLSKPLLTLKLFLQTSKTKNRSFASHIYFFLKCLGYARIIKGISPDHIHVHFLSWPSTMVMIASRLLTIPFSISAHARDVFLEGELLEEKAGYCNFITICNSYAFKKALEKITSKEGKDKLKLIYHGIDPLLFTKDQTSNDSSKTPFSSDTLKIFLGGTRLVEKKGLIYVIYASEILKKSGIKHRIDIVGPGPLYEKLSKQIKDLGLSDTVFIHGEGKGTPFMEVLKYYKDADLFVFPSIETSEGDADGVPTVVIEAAMAKIPIITTSAGGITDLIEDGKTGIVIPQRDEKSLASAIIEITKDPNKACTLTENAYTKAIGMFNIDTNIAKLQELFE